MENPVVSNDLWEAANGMILLLQDENAALKSKVAEITSTNTDRDAMQCISKLLTLCKDDHEFVRGIRPMIENWSTAQHP